MTTRDKVLISIAASLAVAAMIVVPVMAQGWWCGPVALSAPQDGPSDETVQEGRIAHFGGSARSDSPRAGCPWLGLPAQP
ncbi:hypothetical protein H5T53_05450 [Candidatus Bipolaricaulota bacterium]|nr:hypothetical protein [Candidatus Bipolaricaulota bacterium]